MKLTEQQIIFIDSMLEAGAVAAHDFSGQVHVIQFCGEELKSHVSPDGEKFLEKINQGIEHLGNYVKSFRDFIKAQKYPGSDGGEFNFGNCHILTNKTLDIHYMKEFDHSELVSFLFSEELENFEIQKNEFEFVSLLFSLYALLIDNYRNQKCSNAKLSLNINKVDPERSQITIVDEENKLSRDQLLSFLEMDMVGSKKSSRRIYGNKLIQDALNGESELFKIEHDESKGIGLVLSLT